MPAAEGLKRILDFLASTKLAVALFLAISLLAVPGTFTESRAIYSSPPFLFLIGAFGLNLLLCTVRKFKTLSWPVLILHSGVIVTLVGCLVTSFGYVATVNIFEGTTVNQVYRWDLNQDVPLGMNLTITKINREFYPMPVKIGVLKGQVKEGLYTLKTGESFDLQQYRVKVGPPELPLETLKLTVFEQGRLIGTCDTAGVGNLPATFPYAFKLVAYQNPALKRVWVDLLISRSPGEVAGGTAEVNSPFQWGGLYFYNTQIDRAPDGMSFAGVQIVRDPGRPVVFAGLAVMALGAVLTFWRRFYRKGLWK